jgi:hypothetical protein
MSRDPGCFLAIHSFDFACARGFCEKTEVYHSRALFYHKQGEEKLFVKILLANAMFLQTESGMSKRVNNDQQLAHYAGMFLHLLRANQVLDFHVERRGLPIHMNIVSKREGSPTTE